jgi:tRNA pseudouridine55 synthase
VRVDRFELGVTDDPLVWRARIACSSGTYVRTLAADLGTALGGGAHLRSLRRTRVGSFGLDEAVLVEAVTVEGLLAPAEALRDLDAVVVAGELADAVGHGSVLAAEALGATGGGPWRVLGPGGELLAVYEPYRGGDLKPSVVVARSGDGR